MWIWSLLFSGSAHILAEISAPWHVFLILYFSNAFGFWAHAFKLIFFTFLTLFLFIPLFFLNLCF